MTATRGEHGSDDPRRWPPDRLARTRDLEIAPAMAIVGVDEAAASGSRTAPWPTGRAPGGLVGELIEEDRRRHHHHLRPRGDDRPPRPPGGGGMGGRHLATRGLTRPLVAGDDHGPLRRRVRRRARGRAGGRAGPAAAHLRRGPRPSRAARRRAAAPQAGRAPRPSHPDPSAGGGDRRRPVPCLVARGDLRRADRPLATPADPHDLTTPSPRSQRRSPSQSSTNPRHTRRRSRWAAAITASTTSS